MARVTCTVCGFKTELPEGVTLGWHYPPPGGDRRKVVGKLCTELQYTDEEIARFNRTRPA